MYSRSVIDGHRRDVEGLGTQSEAMGRGVGSELELLRIGDWENYQEITFFYQVKHLKITTAGKDKKR